MMECAHIKAERIGRLGRITLDRPQALNALTPEMIAGLHAVLDLWAKDDDIDSVLLRGAGKAFCAGGDVKLVWEAVKRGDPGYGDFFAEEYRLDYRIHVYPKPIICFLTGYVFGGGAGLSMLASHPVACESTVFAMPETAIGLYPDVGATWFLGRCPGSIGRYLGMTGTRIGAADMQYAGLVRQVIPSERFAAIEESLAGGCPRESGLTAVDCLLDSYSELPGPSALQYYGDTLERTFGRASVGEIIQALAEETDDWAGKARQSLAAASPTSLKLAFRQSQLAGKLDLARALGVEYRLSLRMAAGSDFSEGIRARLVDRDNAPRWSPASLEEVEDASINALFAPLGEGRELVLAGS